MQKIKKEKWATFTYYGPETRIITRSFKNTNVGIAFKSSNIIKNHVKLTNQIIDIYQKCGVYQLKCNECPLRYIGQTGRTFKDRYKEHIQAIRTNKHTSKYAQHILDTGHAYGTIEETMDIIQTTKKVIYSIHSNDFIYTT
jgi:hypothetical protein